METELYLGHDVFINSDKIYGPSKSQISSLFSSITVQIYILPSYVGNM